MPRPRRFRRIRNMPEFDYFKPQGIPLIQLEDSILTISEFEAIRLKDLEGLSQKESAEKMEISQPTFHRLILTARKKIADSIVNGKAIKIEGGIYRMHRRLKRNSGLQPNTCKCSNPTCDYHELKRLRIPCSKLKCPKCGSILIRED